MDEHALKRALAHAHEPPPFEAIASTRGARRLRRVRAGLAVLALTAAAAAPFMMGEQERSAEFALAAPPTTDWLLETPDPDWIANLNHQSEEETSDVR